ncbi:4-coumarate--CoA ligase 1-like isoform X1 [Limulus polyphemus]|uniref:4-coumarate--CoA ligase 1-like isoform X1 n=1 Tax=Limulus polyphemus TaxID=6850 RepID=A0ABM1SNP0_LIMPO|nr:4-coumarate--CoA ligase 1-like isoform X1 [Limulus polyphemus]
MSDTTTPNIKSSNEKILRSPRTAVDIPNVSLPEFLCTTLENHPDKYLMIAHDNSRSITIKEVLLYGKRFSSALIRRGLKLGDVFCLCSSNNVDFPAAVLGVMNAGATITLGKPMDTKGELQYKLEKANAAYLLVERENLEKAREATKNLPKFREILVFEKTEGCPSFTELVEEDDGSAFTGPPKIDPKVTPIVLPFSSGTTGLPKAIIHTHFSFLATILHTMDPTIWKYPRDEIVLGMYPFCHVAGFLFLLIGMAEGLTMINVPSYDSDLFLEVIPRHKVSIVLAAVSVIYFILSDPKARQYDFTSVKEILTSGAPLRREANEEVLVKTFPFLHSVRQLYGLSETLFVSCTEKGKTIPNSVGKLYPSMELKVVDIITGTACDVNESGEFLLRGKQLMKAYLNNPTAFSEAFTPDGWYKTGDYGYYDSEGNIYITDRIKEIIKTGFHQVSPTEIESVLFNHPGIEDAAVIGVPDMALGEVPYGFVVTKLNSHVTPDDIIHFTSDRLAPQKQLKGLEILSQIPRSDFGKLQRNMLKERFQLQSKKFAAKPSA